jgi:signal transduction histidine kinase
VSADFVRGEGRAHDWAREVQSVCHDLRQPIATIMMLAETASVPGQLEADVRAALRAIVAEATWMSSIVRDTLGAMSVPDELVDCAAVVDEAIEGYRGSLATLRRTGDRPEWIFGPRTLLRRAIANLLDNAVRAAGSGGTVQVRTASLTGRIVIDVDDDGPGFGAIAPGHGIGLDVVHKAVRHCGGRFEHSTSPLGGVRARLVLPAALRAAG